MDIINNILVASYSQYIVKIIGVSPYSCQHVDFYRAKSELRLPVDMLTSGTPEIKTSLPLFCPILGLFHLTILTIIFTDIYSQGISISCSYIELDILFRLRSIKHYISKV